MRQQKSQDDGENLDRWLLSYADFITLLFAFFVVLYGISSINEGKYRVLSDSLTDAFKATPRSMEPVQVGEISRERPDAVIENQHQPSAPPDEARDQGGQDMQLNLKEMADEIERSLSGLIRDEVVGVRRADNWLEIEINTSILFTSGSARLVDSAVPVLQRIARILKPFPNPINVEGFTDNRPINTPTYPSNWELSAARAASVVHLFTRAGVDPRRMTAIGYGEYRPIADNSTPEGRSKNRRVVLAILAEDVNVRVDRRVAGDKSQGTGFPPIEVLRR